MANANGWQSPALQHYFAIVDNGAFVLGENFERLAEFPHPPANGNEWHGYPIPSNRIDADTIETWKLAGIITPHVRRKLERGDI